MNKFWNKFLTYEINVLLWFGLKEYFVSKRCYLFSLFMVNYKHLKLCKSEQLVSSFQKLNNFSSCQCFWFIIYSAIKFMRFVFWSVFSIFNINSVISLLCIYITCLYIFLKIESILFIYLSTICYLYFI